MRHLIDLLPESDPLKLQPGRTFDHLKAWYNGYCFDGICTVFHPFGVLSCLLSGEMSIGALRHVTATSWLNITEVDFLDALSKEILNADNCARTRSQSLDMSTLEKPHAPEIDIRSLLYQTGFLTEVPGSKGQALMVPNEHARSVIMNLIQKARFAPVHGTSLLGDIFARRDIAALGKLIRDTFEATPYDLLHKAMNGTRGEHVFHINVLHWALLFRSGQVLVESETHTQSGSLDIAITFPQHSTLWVIEFGVKDIDSSPEAVQTFLQGKLEQAQRYAIGRGGFATSRCLAVVFQKTRKASAALAEEFKYATSLKLSKRVEDVDGEPQFIPGDT